jgi:hypothetical protein
VDECVVVHLDFGDLLEESFLGGEVAEQDVQVEEDVFAVGVAFEDLEGQVVQGLDFDQLLARG